MASSTAISGGRFALMQAGLVLVGGFSAVVLFSFGGQLIVAPALLPAQWLIARHTSGPTSVTFSVLGAALAAEVGLISMGLIAGSDDVTVPMLVLVVLVGVLSGVGFYRTSRPTGQG